MGLQRFCTPHGDGLVLGVVRGPRWRHAVAIGFPGCTVDPFAMGSERQDGKPRNHPTHLDLNGSHRFSVWVMIAGSCGSTAGLALATPELPITIGSSAGGAAADVAPVCLTDSCP